MDNSPKENQISAFYSRVVFERLGVLVQLLDQLTGEHGRRAYGGNGGPCGAESHEKAQAYGTLSRWIKEALLERQPGWGVEVLADDQQRDIEAVADLIGVELDEWDRDREQNRGTARRSRA